MLRWILLLSIVGPLLDLVLLIWLGGEIGWGYTLMVLLVAGIAGTSLARREGLRVLSRWRAAFSAGLVPEEGVLDGMLALGGCVLLALPGLISDIVGIALLIRPLRRRFAGRARRAIQDGIRTGTIRVSVRTSRPGPSSTVIDTVGESLEENRRPRLH